jgi:hypothetical protein
MWAILNDLILPTTLQLILSYLAHPNYTSIILLKIRKIKVLSKKLDVLTYIIISS